MESGELRPEEHDQSEPILRGEYERRHQDLQDKYETFSRRTYRILALIVIGLICTGVAGVILFGENTQRTEDITNSQVVNCETSGNPLRAAVRTFGNTLISQTKGDIQQAKAFERSGTYQEIFPSYPKDKLHALLVEAREDQRHEIRELRRGVRKAHRVNCKARFAPSSGQP